jgi:ribose transport system permease protein
MPGVGQAPVSTDRWARRIRLGAFGPIWTATILLFAVSPLVAGGALSHSALQAMLPFAGILAIAAIGQTLVIQQGGLDLSVPGTFSLGVVLVTVVPGGHDGKLALALVVVLLVGVAAGMLNGLLVTRLGITSLVATLGMNAVLVGTVLQVTHGSIAYKATANWSHFASSKVAGVPVPTIVALGLVVVVAAYMRWSVFGRRFDLVGASPLAARAAGLPVARYQLVSYVVAGACYACAGALLAGFLGSPQLFAGNDYLLPTIAAVVLGGTALGGGRGSVVATGVGVLFLSQLEQVVELLGASQAGQDIIQGAIVALGMGLRNAPWRRLLGARTGLAGRGAAATAGPVAGAGSSAASHSGEGPGRGNGPPGGPLHRSSEEEETVDVNP